jgi:hypothetical protein
MEQAAAVQAVPKTVVELRAEATAAGAPAELPDIALPYWILFSGGAPVLVLLPKGLFLSSSDSLASTYRGYFSPVWIEGKFKLMCRMPGCGKVSAYMEISGKSPKPVFPFANAHKHILACRGNPMLTEADSAHKHYPEPASSSSSSSSSSSGVKRGRIEKIEDPMEHLEALSLNRESFRMALILSQVCDGRPLSVSSLGQKYLMNVLKLPTFGLSDRQLKCTFDDEYSTLVLSPAQMCWQKSTAVL